MNESLLDGNSAKPRAGGPSQGQGAYARLIAELRSGALRPGDRLTETDLAERLQVSRTPVREAMRQLEADGLVAHVPRVGAVVRTLGFAEIMELYEMRGVLEGTAARLAARSASGIEIAELAAVNREMSQAAGDPARVYDLNRQFHTTLLDAARNRYLVASVRSVQTTLLILSPSTLEEAARAVAAVAEHDAVITALQARDEAGAEAQMRRHIESAHRTRLRLLRSQGQLADCSAQDDG